MHSLNQFYAKTLQFDLLNKFHYTNLKELPKLKKVILNFNCKTNELKTLSTHLIALELIADQKGIVTTTKRPNLSLKLRKGDPIGCKVELKKAYRLNFLSRSLNEIFPHIKNFDMITFKEKTKRTNLSFVIKNSLNFAELFEHYYLFADLSEINVSIVSTTKTQKELFFLLKSLQFPIKR